MRHAATRLRQRTAAFSIVDNFNRADSATTLGTTSDGTKVWSALAGTWGISTNQAYLPTPNGTRSLAVVDAGLSDCTVSVTLATIAFSAMGLCVRVQDAGNFIAVTYASGTLSVGEFAGGSFNRSLLSTSVTFANGDVLSVVLSGSSLTFKKNGTTVGTATDATYQTNTKHGLYDGSGLGSTQRWEDFSIAA